MDSKIIELSQYPEIRAAIRSVSGKYRKHKAILIDSRSGTYEYHGSYWDGGSRDVAFYVNADGSVDHVSGSSAPPQFGGTGSTIVDIPEGGYIVVLGTFRGKPATAKVYRRSI